jgi:maleamate amidohydrolase
MQTTSIQADAASSDTALVLIDVQNAFFHPEGENFYPEAQAILPQLGTLLAAARRSRRLIIHVADVHRPGLADFESNKLPPHAQSDSFNSCYFPGFGPPAGASASGAREVALQKRRFSAFFGTDLDLLLRENRIGRLVVAGVKTNVCVRATIQDGFGWGYRCLLVEEATNSNRSELAAASLEDIRRYMGWLLSMDAACKALA